MITLKKNLLTTQDYYLLTLIVQCETKIEDAFKDFSKDKEMGANKHFVATIIHNEYKNVLLDNKCLRHLMKIIQNKYHRIGT